MKCVTCATLFDPPQDWAGEIRIHCENCYKKSRIWPWFLAIATVLFLYWWLPGFLGFCWTVCPAKSQTISEIDRDAALATLSEHSYQEPRTDGTATWARHFYDGPDGSGQCVIFYNQTTIQETVCDGPELWREVAAKAPFVTTTSTEI